MSYQANLHVLPDACPNCGTVEHYDPLIGCGRCDYPFDRPRPRRIPGPSEWAAGHRRSIPDSLEWPFPMRARSIAKDVVIIGACVGALSVLAPAVLLLESAALVKRIVDRRLEARK